MAVYKDKWWYSTITIVVLASFWFLIIPLLLAIIFLVIQMNERKKFYLSIENDELLNMPIREKEKKLKQIETEIDRSDKLIEEKTDIINDQEGFINSLRADFDEQVEEEREYIIKKAKDEAKNLLSDANDNLTSVINKVSEYEQKIEESTEKHTKLKKQVNRYINQARKYKADIVGLKNFNERFPHTINFESVDGQLEQLNNELDEENVLGTIVRLHLHSDNSKELRKLSNATNKEIKNLLGKYENRYTTKGNKTIYNLMIIGLQAEIQILLLQLKYNKIDESIQAVKDIITKYLSICASGNKAILPTITRFLTEIEPLYIELINIEYKYYVYREREKEEQKMIKEQMRQEAEERKKLAEEQKKIAKEEKKFETEMARNKKLLEEETEHEKVQQLEDRLRELEKQMQDINKKKEEISTLTLGKAGYVYIISNLGSFGESMFKIGMTRRMVPQDRVDELGSASVPFKFDVHAMIFSDDAVGLEQKLHKMLSQQRVNKVNFRKEFFNIDINNLRKMVEEIDPTVEFVTTMLAEEFNQTIAMEQAEQAAIVS